jgi:tRNA C32,U32 (ribose-2'-O)-methylase TrmJ
MIVRNGVGADLAIALVRPRYAHNVGSAIRAASCYGVPQVWLSGNRVALEGQGKRYRLPREERMKGYGEVEICHADYFFDAFPGDVVPVAIELVPGTENLIDFVHPEKAVYVFGPEDGSLGSVELRHCHRFVRIPTRHCLNLATAVTTVLYDRHLKRVLAGLETAHDLDEIRGERAWEEPDSMTSEVGVA